MSKTMHHYGKLLLSASRQRLTNDDCPEDEREDYQNCSMLYWIL